MINSAKRVIIFDRSTNKHEKVEVKTTEAIEELSGKLKKQSEEDKLMHSVLEGDKDKIDDGKLILESINRGLGSFTPDIIMQNLVNNYKMAEKMFGATIIRKLTNYAPGYVEKNITIPEFQKEIKKNIEENIGKLQEKGLVDKDGIITDQGAFLSSLILYTEELDKLVAKGFGEKRKKDKDMYGEKEDYNLFKHSRYRDLAIKQTVKTAIRRGHQELIKEDLKIFDRKSKGKISIIYGLDASGSMKGDKLATAKKAGVALAFKAIQEKNKVGLIVFGSEIKNEIAPTNDFMTLLRHLTSIRAATETDISKTIKKAIELFPNRKETKHLILLTDALPTKGNKPKQDTMEAVSIAKDQGITVSVIGIQLDEEGKQLAKKIVEVGTGRMYQVKDLKNVDTIILEDYYSLE